jgi:hypothetical protein
VRLDLDDMANVAMFEELLVLPTAAAAVAGVLVIVEGANVRWNSAFRLCPNLLLVLKALLATTGLFVRDDELVPEATFIVGFGNRDGDEDSRTGIWQVLG